MITKFIYPVNASVVLGMQSMHRIPIVPDVPIWIKQCRCNALAAGMFVIEETQLLYQHDPHNIHISVGVPARDRFPFIHKEAHEDLLMEYDGYIPPGYCRGMKFLFTYHFIGEEKTT